MDCKSDVAEYVNEVGILLNEAQRALGGLNVMLDLRNSFSFEFSEWLEREYPGEGMVAQVRRAEFISYINEHHHLPSGDGSNAKRDDTGTEISSEYGEDLEGKTTNEMKELAGFKDREWGSCGELFRDIRLALDISRAHVSRSIGVAETSLRRFEVGRSIHRQGVVTDSYQSFLGEFLDQRISEVQAICTRREERGDIDPSAVEYLAKLGALSTIVSHPIPFLPKVVWDDEEAM